MEKPKLYQPKKKSTISPTDINEKVLENESILFPIVGIGASAGGLEALELLFRNVPVNSGLAYVVIQHLDPTHKGMLPELLQRISKINVFEAKNRMPVKPNCVYVIPPNKSMSILNGVLYLFKPIETRGLRLPIDFFFRSLADDRRELSIGLILSGMGSDGTIGLNAIKEKNGIVMVQDPHTAKFDSMPRSAMDSVMVDLLAPPNELPEKLFTFLKEFPLVISDPGIEIKDKSALEKIIILLRTYTGNDFSLYKKSTIYRRVERRMGVHKFNKINSYVNFLQENPKEVDILFKELLIGVTNFFRDILVWEKLETNVIPDIVANMPTASTLRAWIPGCSTGEEAYSLAIVFKEVLEKINLYNNLSLQIFATDIDNEAIEVARRGVYPENIVMDVSEKRLNRFFVKTSEGYRVKNEIREMVVFAQHNLILHPPFININILSCRNLLIYMDPELQKKVLGLFYYSIINEGIMILGSSESIGILSHIFKPIDSKLKIYKRFHNAKAPDLVNFPSSFSRVKKDHIEKPIAIPSSTNIETLANQLLLQHFSPPGLLVNTNGDILYIIGSTGKYLEPAAGKANLNIFAMLREELRQEFPVAFHQAIMKKDSSVIKNIKISTNGHHQNISIHIKWIDKPEQIKGMVMIVFKDNYEVNDLKLQEKAGMKSLNSIKESELRKELRYTKEVLQSTLEDMQTSQEELNTTNEEFQSANEELQSTNEELSSSKEEMQSLNEELQTVNAELLTKLDDFSQVDNDMKNLLNSTDIATLFLDKKLNIRRFTNEATKIFKLIRSDIGRPFTDQVTDIFYPEMAEDARKVLKTLVFIEKQIPGKNGSWYSIRIMPYITNDNSVDGLVITFINITDLKQMEEKYDQKEKINDLLFDSSSDVIIKLSANLEVLELNSEAGKFFGIKPKDAVSQNFLKMFIPESGRKKSINILNKLLKELKDGEYKVQVITAGGKLQDVKWSVRILRNNMKGPVELILLLKR